VFRGVERRRVNVGPGAWPHHLSGAPSIYFTLGTEFNLESGDLFTRVLAGLRQLPINVFVTVGRQIDPAELGEQPANVRIERYLPQAEILPHCQLVVFHGGSGTLIGALAHGLPMLVCAIGADQPYNALRCSALGLGVSLNPVRLTPDDVRDSVDLLLADPSYRHAAQELQAEIATRLRHRGLRRCVTPAGPAVRTPARAARTRWGRRGQGSRCDGHSARGTSTRHRGRGHQDLDEHEDARREVERNDVVHLKDQKREETAVRRGALDRFDAIEIIAR
jgi:UDP-glucoronosyl and UDP-glucosyl transferase